VYIPLITHQRENEQNNTKQQDKKEKEKSFLSRVNGLFDNSIDPLKHYNIFIYINIYTRKEKDPNKKKKKPITNSFDF
jgi:hypothetical protein